MSGKDHINLAMQLCGYQPRILVTVTELPTGALETMVNNTHIKEKIKYILDNYDEDLRMWRNPKIQIKAVIIL